MRVGFMADLFGIRVVVVVEVETSFIGTVLGDNINHVININQLFNCSLLELNLVKKQTAMSQGLAMCRSFI